MQGVWSFDVATGQRTRVSGDGAQGPAFNVVNGLAIWPGRSTALLNSDDQLLAIDLLEGDRVIVSR